MARPLGPASKAQSPKPQNLAVQLGPFYVVFLLCLTLKSPFDPFSHLNQSAFHYSIHYFYIARLCLTPCLYSYLRLRLCLPAFVRHSSQSINSHPSSLPPTQFQSHPPTHHFSTLATLPLTVQPTQTSFPPFHLDSILQICDLLEFPFRSLALSRTYLARSSSPHPSPTPSFPVFSISSSQ